MAGCTQATLHHGERYESVRIHAPRSPAKSLKTRLTGPGQSPWGYLSVTVGKVVTSGISFPVAFNRLDAILLGVESVSKQKTETDVTNAASVMSRKRWAKVPKKKRAEVMRTATEAARLSRARMKPAVRSELARKAASSISTEAASERAKKAWETRRKNNSSAA